MVSAFFLLQRFLFYLPKDYDEFSSTTETEKEGVKLTSLTTRGFMLITK